MLGQLPTISILHDGGEEFKIDTITLKECTEAVPDSFYASPDPHSFLMFFSAIQSISLFMALTVLKRTG